MYFKKALSYLIYPMTLLFGYALMLEIQFVSIIYRSNNLQLFEVRFI